MPSDATWSALRIRRWLDEEPDEQEPPRVCLAMTYEQWQSVMDALEPGATTRQSDDAQDTLNILAPRPWLRAAEAREEQR